MLIVSRPACRAGDMEHGAKEYDRKEWILWHQKCPIQPEWSSPGLRVSWGLPSRVTDC